MPAGKPKRLARGGTLSKLLPSWSAKAATLKLARAKYKAAVKPAGPVPTTIQSNTWDALGVGVTFDIGSYNDILRTPQSQNCRSNLTIHAYSLRFLFTERRRAR